MACAMCQDADYRVLSIQSHVVSGYCGNKSAVFPLQLLGLEVDFINTVQFSNHTGYASFTGKVLTDQEMLELFQGLKDNGLHARYTHILTGYAGSVNVLQATCSVIKQVKQANPSAIYLCDPVLGDNGKLYQPPQMIPVFREQVIPLASIICPNQFEAELLSGVKIVDLTTAIKAMQCLHEMGPETVVISSTNLDFGTHAQLIALASTRCAQPQGRASIYRISVPRLDVNFIGTGDLFASTFLAWFSKTGFDLKTTLENVIATLQTVIERTHRYASSRPGGLKEWANIELKIIQARMDIIKPSVVHSAQAIPRP